MQTAIALYSRNISVVQQLGYHTYIKNVGKYTAILFNFVAIAVHLYAPTANLLCCKDFWKWYDTTRN